MITYLLGFWLTLSIFPRQTIIIRSNSLQGLRYKSCIHSFLTFFSRRSPQAYLSMMTMRNGFRSRRTSAGPGVSGLTSGSQSSRLSGRFSINKKIRVIIKPKKVIMLGRYFKVTAPQQLKGAIDDLLCDSAKRIILKSYVRRTFFLTVNKQSHRKDTWEGDER